MSKKNGNIEINTYEDLQGKKIGTQLGSTYFERFDKDKTLKKDTTTSFKANIEKLLIGRLDVVVGNKFHLAGLAKTDPDLVAQVKQANYFYDKPNPVCIGISKKSKFGSPQYLDVFKKIISKMYVQGAFEKINHDFYQSYRPNAIKK